MINETILIPISLSISATLNRVVIKIGKKTSIIFHYIFILKIKMFLTKSQLECFLSMFLELWPISNSMFLYEKFFPNRSVHRLAVDIFFCQVGKQVTSMSARPTKFTGKLLRFPLFDFSSLLWRRTKILA